MAASRWKPGAVIRKKLGVWTYYARLLEFPWAAFYRYRTRAPVDDLDEIVANDVLFTLAAHKDLLARGQWESIGSRPLEKTLRRPKAQAIWDDATHCRILDDKGRIRSATPDECKELEPAAVWEPEHVADRLRDAFAGRPDRWLQRMRSRRE
jgi:hypothetical protein